MEVQSIKENKNIGMKPEHGPFRTVLATGLALFAMFFGAGNIVFPLYLGATAGQFVIWSAIGFLIAGVGVPFLGLYATSLYHGDYWDFFNSLGKLPAFLVITFLMIIIGPLFAMPRTETVTFDVLVPYMPEPLNNSWVFSAIYCITVFILVYKESKIIDILGLFLSPVKLIAISTLVIVGLIYGEAYQSVSGTAALTFSHAVYTGYGTMDLIATFFFCTVAFQSIQETFHADRSQEAIIRRLTLKSCIVGALVLSIVYLGFMFLAHSHAQLLAGVSKDHLISTIAQSVLGKFGGLVVGISVSFACLGTAMALAEVTSLYLHREVFHHRVSRHICLTVIMVLTYFMTSFGFEGILRLSLPILEVVYPGLIVLSVMGIIYKTKGWNFVKVPFYVVVLIGAIYSLYDHLA